MTIKPGALEEWADRDDLIYIETGTQGGHSLLEASKTKAKAIYSCDVDLGWVAKTGDRFSNDRRIKVSHQSSPAWLAKLLPTLPPSFLVVLLDAHADNVAPLLSELSTFITCGIIPDVLLIDDWRCVKLRYWGFGEEDVFAVLKKLYPNSIHRFIDGAGTTVDLTNAPPIDDILIIRK